MVTPDRVWRPGRVLRPLLVVLGVLVGAQWVMYTRIDRLGDYPRWLDDPSFTVFMLAEQSLNLLVALVIIGTLLALGRTRREFFLTRVDLAAPVAPIRWLGVGPGLRWSRFGRWLTLCISGGTLASWSSPVDRTPRTSPGCGRSCRRSCWPPP